MKQVRNHMGFSIIEMALSMVMVLSLSAVSYRVLKSQTSQQMVSMDNQKNNRTMQVALNRFKTDADNIDPNWVRYGIGTIWPHQGYGLGQNYYLLSKSQQAAFAVNDGVTFLRRSPQTDRLYVAYTSKKRLCYPSPVIANEDQNLYGVNIPLDSISNLAVGDWMLVYQAGNYALGVISVVSQTNVTGTSGVENRFVAVSGGDNYGTSNESNQEETSASQVTGSTGFIQLRQPNANERQTTALNSSNKSTGFVTKAGVVPANFDMFGNVTASTDDDSFCFDVSKLSFQKVASPVSYFADYRTTDGNVKSSTNAYELDSKQGKQIKMLVRAEYVNGVQKREYIAPIDEVGFTYDLINDEESGENRIARNVGRSKGSDFLINLGVSNPAQASSSFLTSYKIVSVKMGVGATVKDPQKPMQEWKQTKEMKIALDPSVQEDAYQTDTKLISSLTNSLKSVASSSNSVVNEQIGKPLYLATSGQHEVIVPTSVFQMMSDGTLGNESAGLLYVYDTAGCAVNHYTGNCSPNSNSAIQFKPGTNSTFFPNTVSQVDLPDGNRRIIVGGVAMGNQSTSPTRTPGIGIITLGPNESLKEKLQNTTATGSCNIDNCQWKPIATNVGDNAELLDTAHVAVDPVETSHIYIAPLTKHTGKDSQSSVYRGVWNGSDYNYTKFASIVGTEEGKVITAISDRPIRINNQTYLAVCLSKNMSSSCGGECLGKPSNEATEPSLELEPADKDLIHDDGGGGKDFVVTEISEAEMYGEIQLVNQGTNASSPGFVLARHNYKCSSINVDDNQNLVVAGRLTAQPYSIQDIKRVLSRGDRRPPTALTETSTQTQILAANSATQNLPMMYLDEVIAESEGATYYADYYQVDPETYENSSNPQYIGWLTGMSTVEFPDGTFGIVNGNKYRLAPNFGINTSQNPKEFSNAGISKVRLAGMNDRVVATIQTDPENINNSVITAVYSARASELPSVYIKGSFFAAPGRQRTSPTPLPALPPALNDKSWLALYQALVTPRAEGDLNSNMPILGSDLVPVINCQNTKPKTCN